MNVQCYKCKSGYDPLDPEDFDGFGKCSRCKSESQKIAREIDAKIAKYRRATPLPPSKYKQLLDRLPPDRHGGMINARDLGVTFRP